MSSLVRLFGRRFAALFRSDRAPPDIDSMSLRDWADLPAHHPISDRAPC